MLDRTERSPHLARQSERGVYVKARYQKLCQEANSTAASSSDSSHKSTFWKRIWKLHIPNKIKLFVWRACSNALPTKDNLKKKKILEDAKSNAYPLDQEKTLHALWSCETLNKIWTPYFSWVVQTEYPHLQDMQELINLVGQRERRLELFEVVAWFIWNQRNKQRLNEKGLPSDKLFEAARVYLSDFQSKIQETKVQQPKESIKW